ncbi:HAD-like domain-containing protein [Cytidiella melzeri]|nr:HAD-like domain-containing protein [Cytidiella melzeri]
MNLASLVRASVRRGVPAYSVRSYASRPPPPPKTPQGPLPSKQTFPVPPESTTEPQDGPISASKPLSELPSLDFAPGEGPQYERTGAKSSKDSLSSIERKRRFMGRVSMAMLLLGAGAATWYSGREWEEDELKQPRMKVEDNTRWGRTKQRFTGLFGTFTEPLWTELLPPPLPPPHQKPYTLLLSLDDLLITSTWDRQYGWRTAKRPGADYFIAYLSQFYEIVLFTTQQHYTATPIVEKLDPYQFWIQYRLFRDATRSVNGQPVKDLSYLNRDLSKVILLDTHPEHVTAQPENAIVIPKWDGKPGDKGLISLIPFLESIAIYKSPDVRPILEAYRGKNIPLEYAAKEAEAKQKHIEEWEKSHKGVVSDFTLSGLFGGSPSTPTAPGSKIPLTYLEQKRLEAQRMYREEQAYIAANKANFDKLIKEEQEALEKQMPNTFLGAMGAILGPPPQPPTTASSNPPTTTRNP